MVNIYNSAHGLLGVFEVGQLVVGQSNTTSTEDVRWSTQFEHLASSFSKCPTCSRSNGPSWVLQAKRRHLEGVTWFRPEELTFRAILESAATVMRNFGRYEYEVGSSTVKHWRMQMETAHLAQPLYKARQEISPPSPCSLAVFAGCSFAIEHLERRTMNCAEQASSRSAPPHDKTCVAATELFCFGGGR